MMLPNSVGRSFGLTKSENEGIQSKSDLNQIPELNELLSSSAKYQEARLFFELPDLGEFDFGLLEKEIEFDSPNVEAVYKICPVLNIIPTIDPGDYPAYLWYRDGNLISTNPTFQPLQPGNYELIVYDEIGNPISSKFEARLECDLRVTYPNAIEIGNPSKGFEVFANYAIDELEVFIFNKFGEMVFNCKQTDLSGEESSCFWDGTFNGNKIPTGSYSVKISYLNYDMGLVEFELGAITVFE